VLTFVPIPGTVLVCHYDLFSQTPLMTKSRPVVVLQPTLKTTWPRTLVVAPFNTLRPVPIESWHYEIHEGQYRFLRRFDAPADPSIVAGVPPSRLAAMANSANATTTYLLKKNVPQVDIGNGLMPSAATAQQFGVSEAVLSTVFWGGVNADYDRLRSDGASLSSALRASHRVHVSAANGSDFTFAVAPKGGQVNDGTVSAADRVRGGPAVDKQLPAGDVYVLPVAGSAKGTIVLGDFKFNGQLVSGLTLRFSNGTMTSMNAKSGLATIKKYYATGGADRDKFAWLDIGVNRTMHVPASRLWGAGPSMAAGYLTIGTGNNLFFGGSLHSPFAPTSNVPNATVMLDGKAIVTNGALAATP